jgi:hypothetical protein
MAGAELNGVIEDDATGADDEHDAKRSASRTRGVGTALCMIKTILIPRVEQLFVTYCTA